MEHYSKRINAIVWGLALLVFGICWILSALEIINFNVLFDGWWTLFIIVPCFCNLFSDKNKTGAAIGVAMGVLLLLGARGIISWEQVGKLALGVIIIIAGLGLILGRLLKRIWPSKHVAEERITLEDGKEVHNYEVSFGEQTAKLDGEVFDGANAKCSFGAMQIDLRQAQITNNAIVNIECSFGAMEILVPTKVTVKTSINSSFGSAEVTHANPNSAAAPTLHIQGKVSFAGVEIKDE